MIIAINYNMLTTPLPDYIDACEGHEGKVFITYSEYMDCHFEM